MLVREQVFEFLNKEDDYARRKWGGFHHDRNLTFDDWIDFAQSYIDDARVAIGNGSSNQIISMKVLKATNLLVNALAYQSDTIELTNVAGKPSGAVINVVARRKLGGNLTND
jgi:hypothetical protein